jgi:hypothetical protein
MDYASLGSLDAINTVISAVDAAGYIVDDPALPQIINSIQELHALEVTSATTSSGRASGSTGHGIGLRNFVMPIKAYVQIKKNPILGYLTIGAILSIPFVLGYLYGKK